MRTSTLSHSAGFALPTALILMVIIVLIALSSVEFSATGLRQAGNDETAIQAQESAQSVIDATVADADNTPVIGNAGYKVCTPGVSGCNANTISLPGNLYATEISAGDVVVTAERADPAFRPPPRGLNTSVAAFTAAVFAIEGAYDKSDEGLGQTEIREGVVILVPKQQ